MIFVLVMISTQFDTSFDNKFDLFFKRMHNSLKKDNINIIISQSKICHHLKKSFLEIFFVSLMMGWSSLDFCELMPLQLSQVL